MDLTSLKGWQWALIGVTIGSVVGYSWMSMPPSVARSGNVEDFKTYVGRLNPGRTSPVLKDQPIIKNIVVMPPETDPDGNRIYQVSFDRLGLNGKDEMVYRADSIYAKTPFEAGQTVAEFLNARQVSFSDRTGPGRYRPVYTGAAVGLFTLGVLWPAFIHFLVGAGLEKPKPREVKKVYASGPQNDGTVKDKKKGVNAKDLRDLDALNAKLELSVGKGLQARDGSHADAKTVDEIVSQLMSSGGSRHAEDPTATVPVAQPEEQKEYQGEWYPVVKPKAHHDEVK